MLAETALRRVADEEHAVTITVGVATGLQEGQCNPEVIPVELPELLGSHFPRTHRKLAVLFLPKT